MEEASEEEMAPRIKKARERAAKERKERLSRALDQLDSLRSRKQRADRRVSTTDPECRVMGQSDGGYAPSYNVQISTDAKEKVVVGVGVSQSPADQTLFSSALNTVEKTAGLPGQVVVDAGFTTRDAIITAAERGINLIGSFPDASAGKITLLTRAGISKEFYPEHFRFDHEKNVYVCPEGNVLAYEGTSVERGKTIYRYRGKHCKDCPSKPSCCPLAQRGRGITRTENDPRIDAFLTKMETDEAKAVYRQRGEVAEFPNAWIKEKFRLRQFRLRGLLKVEMEVLWACLTYNIKIWMRLCGKPRLAA